MYERVANMKRIFEYILGILLVIPFFAGCQKMEDHYTYDEIVENRGIIAPYCMVENSIAENYSSGRMGTKALINQNSSPDTILCNFLRIDGDDMNRFSNDAKFATDWREAYLAEGSVSTIPDNTPNNLRTISLMPKQPYYSENKDRVSRMVGWYPRVCELPENDQDQEAVSQFKDFSSNIVVNTSDGNEYVGIKFTGLDGSKDVMVTDVRDGSFNTPFSASNFFTFKHYLSAVKIYARAENSSQDVSMWGQIDKVVILNQPTSCVVSLPQKPYEEGVSTGYGEVVEWGTEAADFPLITSSIYGPDKANTSDNEAAEDYPIILEGNSIEHYLGYSLIKPNTMVVLQIFTTTGIYNVGVEPVYNEKAVFKAGYIYNIHLDFKTDGTIAAFLEHSGNEKYFDLTKGEKYQIDSDGDNDIDSLDATLYRYKYSNCYIVKSNPAGDAVYDGFCYDASIVGNGEDGIISIGAQSLYPTSAHISPKSAYVLWETSPNLVYQVELIYGYVRFKVAKNLDSNGNFVSFKEGNAVIAVYDDDRNILWSWHIWITDAPQDISYTEGSTTITIMDRNLGATAAKWNGNGSDVSSGEPLETYGLYYQWGRKDPSMGPPTWDYSPINMTTAPYYDYSSEVYNSAEVVREAAPTLKDAVENPMYMILPTAQTQSYYFNWLYQKIDFLWGYEASTGNTHKTIYDPCPYGYRVSGGEMGDLIAYATSLSSTGSYTLEDYGQKIRVPIESGSSEKSEYYFPYTGYKGVDRGLNSLVCSWKYVGQKADYQSSIVSRYTDDGDYYMHRSRVYLSKASSWSELNVGNYTGHQISDFTNRRTAAPVRCVKDENHNRVIAHITPSQYTVTANSVIYLKLFAESFGGNLSSATLSVAYHLLNDDKHQEYVVENWNNIGGHTWTKDQKFNFAQIYKVDADGNKTSDKIDLSETTGNFRFILHVKNEHNINRMSSTTVTLAKNYVSFDAWKQIDTVYVGESINRSVRIYGDSKPVQILMYKNSEPEGVDITANLSVIHGSSYTYDYYCSTNGLSYATKGWNSVYFKITFESGETITTHEMNFKVRGITLTEVKSVSSESDAYYVIKNNSINGYLYDGGAYMQASTTFDYNSFFKFTGSSGKYIISNVATSDYVSLSIGWNTSLTISTIDSNSATEFDVSYSSEYLYFTISYSYSSWRKYYWNLDSNSDNVDTATSSSTGTAWKIYRVSADESDIPPTPPQ